MAKLHMLKSVTDTINTSFVIQDNDSLIVFDGGFPTEADYLHDYLKSLGGVVNAWFLTHAHDDHISAIFTLLNKYNDITIEGTYFTFPSDDFFNKYEPIQQDKTTVQLIGMLTQALEKNNVPITKVKTDDIFNFGNISVRVLRTYDESLKHNAINNSCTVYRVEVNGKSIIFLGDLGVEGGQQLLDKVDPELLHCDYLQMAHHGQNGVEKPVYQAIKPRFCLWCTPSWLWDNMGQQGYDTGPFKTVVVRGWMSQIRSAEKHYRMIDGTQVIEL